MKMDELDKAIKWAKDFLEYAEGLKQECEYSHQYKERGKWPERSSMRRVAVMLWKSLPALQK